MRVPYFILFYFILFYFILLPRLPGCLAAEPMRGLRDRTPAPPPGPALIRRRFLNLLLQVYKLELE